MTQKKRVPPAVAEADDEAKDLLAGESVKSIF